MYRSDQHIHFVGIGGIGMSGLAELLLNMGHKVSGSDLKSGNITKRLAGMGATVHQGHHPDYVDGADVVVVTSAIDPENPEVKSALSKRIPVIPRAEMLAEFMRLKYGIAVSGAHGKTSCTSMIATLMAAGGLDPTVVVGGKMEALGTNARLGKGEFLVAEADESDGSFSKLSPVMVVITNMDREHMDHYGSEEALEEAFVDFMNKVPFYGVVILCLDDQRLAGLIPRVNKRILTYGFSSQADLQARNMKPENLGGKFELYYQGELKGEVHLPVPGKHNVLNCLGALAAAVETGMSFEDAIKACGNISGVRRRFEKKGLGPRGCLVMDDYAHHPTEIKATLQAARDCWPDRKLVVCFQPHRYSRTRDLFDRFATAFYGADRLLILDIYAASEAKDPEVHAETLAQAIRDHGHRSVEYVGSMERALKELADSIQSGDVVFSMGAGDVTRVGSRLTALYGEGDET